MVLLRGLGVTLEFGDGRQQSLRTVGDMAQFDGAVPTQCRLLNGPCTDLNLMVANEARVQARVEALAGPIDVQAAPLETTLIFSIESGLRLEGGGGEVAHLEPWDLALLSAGRVRARAAPAGAGATPRPVFFATISS
jgi:environmental stress-induced protein Ves